MFDLGKNLKTKETFAGMIYGVPGVGKTTLSLSCKNPVLLDCDDGVERVEYRHRAEIPILKPLNFTEIMDVVLTKCGGIDTIVVDTIGSLVDYMMEHVMTEDPKLRQRDGTPTIKAYGAIKSPFKSLLSAIKTQGKSVLFIGHADEKMDGTNTTYRVQCSGSTANLLISMLDFVGFCDMLGMKRVITFTPSERAYAKNSLSLPPTIDIPDITACANNFMQTRIEDAIKKRAAECNSEMQTKFDWLIDQMTKSVADCMEPDNLNEVMAWGGTLTHIWESKQRLWAMLQKRAAEINAEYSAAEKKFVKNAQAAA